jgi:hypothetical protein
MVVVAITLITAMGILYIISAGNPGMISRAKQGLWAVLIGVVIMLTAWLMINTVLTLVASSDVINGNGNFLGLKRGDGAFGLSCSTTSTAGSAHLPSTTSTPGGGGNGTCAPITDPGNPCSITSLQKTGFGALGDDVVRQASMICNKESNGNPVNASGTDHCGSKTGPVVSYGLFQVNLTTENIANGLCIGSNAIAKPPLQNVKHYSDGWYDASCQMVAGYQSRYETCKAKAVDPAFNIEHAVELYKSRGWQPWSYSKKACGL